MDDELSKENIITESLTNRTVSGLLWMSSGKGFIFVARILVVAILARLLTPVDFGIVTAALVVAGFAEIFSRLGLGPALIHHQDLEERDIQTAFFFSALLGIFSTIFIYYFSSMISSLFNIEELGLVLQYISIIFIIHGISIVAESLLERSLKFQLIAAIEIASYLIGYAAVAIVLAYLGLGVWALVIAVIAQAALRSTLLILCSPHSKRLRFEYDSFKKLMHFGVGYSAGNIPSYFSLQGDNFIVGNLLGAQALGFYSRAYQLLTIPADFFGQVLDKVLFPAMAKVKNENFRLTIAFKQGISIIAIIVLPLSIFSFTMAPELINVVFGPGWLDVVIPFKILAIGMFFRTSYKMGDTLCIATGNVYTRAWIKITYAILVIIGALVGHYWGIEGVAMGVLAAISINFVLTMYISLKIISMPFGAFIAMHIPAILLTALIYLQLILVLQFLSGYGVIDIVIVIVTIVTTMLSFIILIFTVPKLFLGNEGILALNNILIYSNSKFGKIKIFDYLYKHLKQD